MKEQKNHSFKTISMVVILSFIGTLGLSVLAPHATRSDEEIRLASYEKAKSIARAISVRLSEDLTLAEGQRRPASAAAPNEAQGYMGSDDSGQPYHYSVLKTDQGVARVVIRSGGPKGPIEYVEEGGQELPAPAQDRPASPSEN
jgi:hypothetical protein